MRYSLIERTRQFGPQTTERPSEWSQARRALLDFLVIMLGLTVIFALVGIVGARAIPLPILGLIAPAEFALMTHAVEAVHGTLAATNLAQSTPPAGASDSLAITLACTFFSALLAMTLWIFRRVRRTYSWRWSAHFD